MNLMRAIAAIVLLTILQFAAGAQDTQSTTASSSGTAILPDYPEGSTVGLVASDKVRVRSKPSRSSAIVINLDAGALALVQKQSDSSEDLGGGRYWWYQVKLPDGTTGWIYGEFLFFFKNSDSNVKPLEISLGSRHYALVAFEEVVDPSPRNQVAEVDKMPVFVEEGAHRALPIKIDQRTARIKNPDGWYMIKATLDEGADWLTDVNLVGDGQVRVTVQTINGSSKADLQLTCVLRDDPNRPYFDVSSTEGKRDLFELVRNGTVDLVREAIAQGADVNARDADGLTPLLLASTEGADLTGEVIDALLKAGANVNATIESNGTTSLEWAAQRLGPGAIKILLRSGAKLDAGDLMEAAGINQNPEVIAVFLGAGADVNARAEDGSTALMEAAKNNRNPDVVLALLKAGADLKARNKDGVTVLMYAARENRNPEVISILLKAGADPKAKDSKGKTAFDYAQDNRALKGTDAYRQLQKATR
jgi:ankyrin repeat protein/uncharacterized protein YgiM (DUF1202 family)